MPILTPAQHRERAEFYRAQGPEGARPALLHEQMAKVVERAYPHVTPAGKNVASADQPTSVSC